MTPMRWGAKVKYRHNVEIMNGGGDDDDDDQLNMVFALGMIWRFHPTFKRFDLALVRYEIDVQIEYDVIDA